MIAEVNMVAGNTKKIIVIKNISSNLIEEAILILRNEPGVHVHNTAEKKDANKAEKQDTNKSGIRNDFILKEAENIINQYIRENGLVITQNKHNSNTRDKRIRFLNISVNSFINILFIAASAFLIFVLSRLF
jgi:hypothetical protein